jgi:DNA-binding transcriptional ArsR family regulator
MNMSEKDSYELIGSLLRVLGHPVRLQILMEIGSGEACVCHLEEQLKIRQAYLSQHLMALREEGILHTQREGRFIYYRLAKQELLDVIQTAGKIKGFSIDNIPSEKKACGCPKCSETS